MTEDQPKVGTIYVVDAGTIGRVMKVDDTQVVMHTLDYPFFRLIPLTTFDLMTIKVADTTQKALQQLVAPTLEKDWSVEAWELEIDDLVEYVRDDIDDEFDEPNIKSLKFQEFVKLKVLQYVKESEWITDSTGQEKTIKYSIHYLDIEPDDILKNCPSKERHIWSKVRKASALTHLCRDVYEQVIESLGDEWDNDYDTDFDEDEDD